MKKILTVTLAFALFAGAAQAQTKDSSRHHRKGGHEGHQMMAKKLDLTADQQAKLKTIREAQHQEMKALRENKSLTAEQSKAQRLELQKKYRSQFESVLTSTQKEQLAKQKSEWKNKEGKKGSFNKDGKHQKGGKDFKRGGGFGQDLNLSQDQKDKMQKMRADSKTRFESIRNDKNLSDEQKKEKMKEFKNQQHEQMKSILTPEQLEKLKSGKKTRSEKSTK